MLQHAWAVVNRDGRTGLVARRRDDTTAWVIVGNDGRYVMGGNGAQVAAAGWTSAVRLDRTPGNDSLFRTLDDATGHTCHLCPRQVAPRRKKYCAAHGKWADALHARLVERAEGDSYGRNAYSGPVTEARLRYERRLFGIFDAERLLAGDVA